MLPSPVATHGLEKPLTRFPESLTLLSHNRLVLFCGASYPEQIRIHLKQSAAIFILSELRLRLPYPL